MLRPPPLSNSPSILAVAIAAVLSLSIVAHAAATATTQKRAPEVVRFSSSGAFPSPRPNVDLTEGMGAFKDVEKEFDTKVEASSMAAGTTAMAALLGGSIDFLVASGNAFGRAAILGQPVVALMELSHEPGGAFVAPIKFVSRGIGSVALQEWNGARWGVTSVGGAGEFDARRAIEDAGLSWKAQNIVYTGSVPATAAAMVAGRLDIGSMDVWPAATLISNKRGFLVLNFVTLDGDDAWNHQLDWVLVARKETVERYPDLSRAMVRAEVRGLLKAKALKANPAQALSIYPRDVSNKVSPQTFAVYWALCVPGYQDMSGLITPRAVRATLEILKDMHVVGEGQNFPEGAYDNSILLAAYKDLDLPLPKE